MPMPKGHKNPNAGRKPGSKNKATLAAAERLADLKCDPLEGMAKIAAIAMKEKDYTLAGNMYKELAQYQAPKLKSVEVKGNADSPVEMVIKWADS